MVQSRGQRNQTNSSYQKSEDQFESWNKKSQSDNFIRSSTNSLKVFKGLAQDEAPLETFTFIE